MYDKNGGGSPLFSPSGGRRPVERSNASSAESADTDPRQELVTALTRVKLLLGQARQGARATQSGAGSRVVQDPRLQTDLIVQRVAELLNQLPGSLGSTARRQPARGSSPASQSIGGSASRRGSGVVGPTEDQRDQIRLRSAPSATGAITSPLYRERERSEAFDDENLLAPPRDPLSLNAAWALIDAGRRGILAEAEGQIGHGGPQPFGRVRAPYSDPGDRGRWTVTNTGGSHGLIIDIGYIPPGRDGPPSAAYGQIVDLTYLEDLPNLYDPYGFLRPIDTLPGITDALEKIREAAKKDSNEYLRPAHDNAAVTVEPALIDLLYGDGAYVLPRTDSSGQSMETDEVEKPIPPLAELAANPENPNDAIIAEVVARIVDALGGLSRPPGANQTRRRDPRVEYPMPEDSEPQPSTTIQAPKWRGPGGDAASPMFRGEDARAARLADPIGRNFGRVDPAPELARVVVDLLNALSRGL